MAFKSFLLRRDTIHFGSVFLILISAYIWSMPGTVVLEDDGLFIMAAYFNGVGHPPGYPLYTLLAHVSTWIPLGSVACRVHMLSGLFAALACVILWVISFRLFQEKIAAYATALSFGFSLTFWSQSIIAEVYTLNVLFTSVIFINCLLLIEESNDENFRRKLNLLFFLYGLALTNHWPLLILTTPMFIALLWPGIIKVIKWSLRSLPYLIIGLLPYLWMVVRSNMDVEISFYGPIESWNDFWFYISRQGYYDIDFSPSADWIDRFNFVSYSMVETARQFGQVGPVFILGGIIYQFFILKKNIILSLMLGYLGSTVVLICFLGFDYDLQHRAIYSVYPLIAYFCASIWLGIGVIAVSKLCVYLGKGRIVKKIPVLGFTMLVSITSFVSNLPENYRHNDLWAMNYARTILDSMPANAILFLSSDEDVGSVGYLNKVEGYRNDVELYNAKGLVFDNRLFRPFKVNHEQIKVLQKEFVDSAISPIFYMPDYYTNTFMQIYGQEYYGLYSGILKEERGGFVRVILVPGFQEYWDRMVSSKAPYDPWERIHYKNIMSSGCKLLVLIRDNTHKKIDKDDEMSRLLDSLCDNLQGFYVLLSNELQKNNPDWGLVDQLIAKAGTRLNESRGKSETALLDYYRGEALYNKGDYENAILAHQKSLEIWNHPDNPSRLKIIKE